jgi:ABC-type uncharacterized transport system substrate-binding protein
VAFEYRWAEGHYDRLPSLAADLLGRNVDVIVIGTTPATLAAKSPTSTIPIVFNVSEPVGQGAGRQFLPAGRQPHGLQHDVHGADAQAARAALRGGSPD